MTSQTPIDALFFSYYEEQDRWHNDDLVGSSTSARATMTPIGESGGNHRLSLAGMQSVSIDGQLYDLSRFLSQVASGSTLDYRRYNSGTLTHLSGSFYESLAAKINRDLIHINHATRSDLPKIAELYSPRCVMLSSTFFTSVESLSAAARNVREIWPDVPLIMGGLYLIELSNALTPRQFKALLSVCSADAYVQSPSGEDNFVRILERESDGLEGLELPQSWIRRGNQYEWCAEPETVIPFDENWVRWDAIPTSSLYHTVHMRTARSCAFECSFCSFPVNQGPLTLGSLDCFERELEALSRTNVRSLIFVDDTFNVPMPRFRKIVDILAKFDFEWYSYFRCQYADDDIVQRMVASGCRAVFLGLESLNDGVLKNMSKAVNIKAYDRGVTILKRHGVICHANFIVGFPGDRPEYAQVAAQFMDDHGIDFFNASVWFCSPSTPIWQRREEFGIEGGLFEWKHNTMNSTEAKQIATDIIDQTQHSIWISDLSAMNFWSAVMMLSNKMELEDLRRLFQIFTKFAGHDTILTNFVVDPDIQWLKRLLTKLNFAQPVDLLPKSSPLPR